MRAALFLFVAPAAGHMVSVFNGRAGFLARRTIIDYPERSAT